MKPPISERLNELLTERELGTDELKKATGIPRRFIEALRSGNLSELPSPPYVRAYLKKIASVLNIDSVSLLADHDNQISGFANPKETRPESSKQTGSGKKMVFLLPILIILSSFVGYRFDEIVGRPAVAFSLPQLTASPELEVSGFLLSGDELKIDGETIYPKADNSFSTTISLEPGANTVIVDIKRFLGKETVVSENILYRP